MTTLPDAKERRPLPTDGAPETTTLPRISIPGSDQMKARPAYVSLWAPAGRRRQWMYSYRCGKCGVYQFGRRGDLASVAEIRRAGCGHLIRVIISKIYGGAT